MTEYRHIPENLGKIPPQAIDFEESVLGCMINYNETIDYVFGILHTSEVFYKESNQLIFSAIKSIYDNNNPVNVLTISEQLKKEGNLDSVGGAYYLSLLMDNNTKRSEIEYHSYVILDKYIKRQGISTAAEINTCSYDESSDVETLIELMSNKLDSINDVIIGVNNNTSMKDIIKECNDEYLVRQKASKENKLTGIPTGISRLDTLLTGWNCTDLIIVGARPSNCKTSLSLHFAKTAAKLDNSVAFFSLEMSKKQLGDRLLLSECDIDEYRYNTGFLTKEELDLFGQSQKNISSLQINIDDKAGCSRSYLKAQIRKMVRTRGVKLIVIDYLQLTKSDSDDFNKEYGKTCKVLKNTAKELKVPIILLSQLSRNVENRKGDNKPRLSDLRDSGEIEQDADIVLLLWRPEKYGIETFNGIDSHRLIEIVIAKNRNGATGDVLCKMNETCKKFYDVDGYEPGYLHKGINDPNKLIESNKDEPW